MGMTRKQWPRAWLAAAPVVICGALVRHAYRVPWPWPHWPVLDTMKGDAMTNIAVFPSVPKMKAAVKASGNHFFDPGTMRFFHSKVESGLIAGSYFVTSESMDEPGDRRFTPRYFTRDDDGTYEHHDIGEFMGCRTLAEAKAEITAFIVDRREREYVRGILGGVGLTVGPVEAEDGLSGLIREDGEYILGEVLPRGEGVRLCYSNTWDDYLVRDFSTPRRFVDYMRQEIDRRIAELAGE